MSAKTEVQWGYVAHYTDNTDSDRPVDCGRCTSESDARSLVDAMNQNEDASYKDESGILDEHHATYRVTKRTITKNDWEVVE